MDFKRKTIDHKPQLSPKIQKRDQPPKISPYFKNLHLIKYKTLSKSPAGAGVTKTLGSIRDLRQTIPEKPLTGGVYKVETFEEYLLTFSQVEDSKEFKFDLCIILLQDINPDKNGNYCKKYLSKFAKMLSGADLEKFTKCPETGFALLFGSRSIPHCLLNLYLKKLKKE